ncbi:hypothetical protein TPHA_0B03160 [Tetrapisispora phaffii CBS 4417]|uniref:Uncharacterized protein n=1 Tax=Tetrapisispora phaffii (strain ATCC 24235 / CBS 4417 / NBRC 1672 / NRRL Y-8282 / UCD 70-5) TaxID=1071381 RepID=G8BPQ7_TETPH|nr:hypothetical protein TPHA_0B03160 [Tetrapisispora phaffii CBS 4417]CCE61988.1 hypothetical protein TPHA_0B03160 [Tetrapisispora phaffii CBS 4417]
MSLFRTLQNQPRVISLFTQGVEVNSGSKILYNELNKHCKSADAKTRFNIEVHKTFPTLDQLKYMVDINPKVVEQQVPNLMKIISAKNNSGIFGSSLETCIKEGIWNPEKSIWMDWEKKSIGNNLSSLQTYLKSLETK